MLFQHKTPHFLSAALVLLLLLTQGCKKYVVVDVPIDQIETDVVFESDSKAGAAVRGMYATMAGSFLAAFGGGLTLFPGLTADEMITTNTSFAEFYNNAILPSSSNNGSSLYAQFYTLIYQANAVIEGVEKSTKITASLKPSLLGESKFIRSLCYFYLTNLYDSVPLVTSTDFAVNTVLTRSGPDKIYQQIIDDLKYAQTNLGTNFTAAGTRIRANKFAAAALLARVYLYRKQWKEAEDLATTLITSGIYKLEPLLNNVFLASSKEAIFQLVQPGSNLYTWDGYLFSLNQHSLAPTVLAAFETGDLRKTNWVTAKGTSSIPFKYKISGGTGTAKTEYSMLLRLGEQYLVRAEARANQDKLADAMADVDSLRKRAAVPLLSVTNPAITKDALLTAIAHERQVELFAEMGHRWFDVKRTGKADAIFGAVKSGWTTNMALYPIPSHDRELNPLLTQNNGYN